MNLGKQGEDLVGKQGEHLMGKQREDLGALMIGFRQAEKRAGGSYDSI